MRQGCAASQSDLRVGEFPASRQRNQQKALIGCARRHAPGFICCVLLFARSGGWRSTGVQEKPARAAEVARAKPLTCALDSSLRRGSGTWTQKRSNIFCLDPNLPGLAATTPAVVNRLSVSTMYGGPRNGHTVRQCVGGGRVSRSGRSARLSEASHR